MTQSEWRFDISAVSQTQYYRVMVEGPYFPRDNQVPYFKNISKKPKFLNLSCQFDFLEMHSQIDNIYLDASPLD